MLHFEMLPARPLRDEDEIDNAIYSLLALCFEEPQDPSERGRIRAALPTAPTPDELIAAVFDERSARHDDARRLHARAVLGAFLILPPAQRRDCS